MRTAKSVLRYIRSGMEPHLKKLVFIILLSLLKIAAPSAATNDMEVYLDIPLHLSLNLSSNVLAFGELSEAGEEGSITLNIRSNTKSWKISAKATYAALTWGATAGEAWVAPAPGATLIKIPYRVSFADTDPYLVLFPLATLTANLDKTLYSFTRKTTGGLNGENFSFTVHVDPKAASTVWESGEYQDIILLTVTAL